MDSRRDLLICLDKGIIPHPLEDAGILLDAYMGGALVPKGRPAMACAQTDPRIAARELVDRLHDVGDLQMFTGLGINPPGWEVVRWDNLGLPQGMFEMAQSLAADG